MFNQHLKNTNIKLKHTKLLKKLSSAILATLLLATSLPISNVYANDAKYTPVGGVNQGTMSSSSGGPSSAATASFGDFNVEGVRAYIYDTQSAEFIEGANSSCGTFKAIDFLGFDGAYGFSTEMDTIYYDTALGSLSSQDVVLKNDWPFGDNFFADYVYMNSNGEKVNGVIPGTYDTCESLKADNADKLETLLRTYWGDNVRNQFRSNPNLLMCFEPIFQVSCADGDDVVTESELDTSRRYYECGTKEFITPYTTCIPVSFDEIQADPHTGGGLTYLNLMLNGSLVTITADDNDLSISKLEGDELLALLDRLESGNTNDKSAYKEYTNGIIDHFDKLSFTLSTTQTVYKYYKYVYGTARTMYEATANGSIRPASNYDISNWVANACFCSAIGEDGEFNDDYSSLLTFPDGINEKGEPTYNGGKTKQLYDNNGTPTTWGIALLASKELAGCIWHTNDYTTDETSAAPSAAAKGGPNESLAYGNNTVVKIYETRDKNTGKLISTISHCSALDTEYGSGIPDVISIEDELEDKWISEKVDVLGTEVTRTWVKWMSSKDIGEFNSDEEVKALGSGYIVADWCTGNRSWGDALEISQTDNDENGGYSSYAVFFMP